MPPNLSSHSCGTYPLSADALNTGSDEKPLVFYGHPRQFESLQCIVYEHRILLCTGLQARPSGVVELIPIMSRNRLC
ncbi:hypothetical protein C8Q79DRAFT_972035 [Trametes meyenii]|nr:hypothetical protein C8Q79DRAFT_972035 [Trametes meyenii]